jgi:hypothetical protein
MNAKTEQKSAKLSDKWGYRYAVQLFGQEAIDSLPVLKSGPNKGKPAGYICWLKTTTPGYSPYVGGGTRKNMVVRAWTAAGPFSPQSDALSGMVFGRIQQMCLSRCYLGANGRKLYADQAERAGEA